MREREPKTPPSWLLIVQRDRQDLYGRLTERFQGSERVEVILDARRGERRRSQRPGDWPTVFVERRRAERRQPLPDPAPLDARGFYWIARPNGSDARAGRTPAS